MASQEAIDFLAAMRCSVCGAGIESIHVRKAEMDWWPGPLRHVEETITCEDGHIVIRLTSVPPER